MWTRLDLKTNAKIAFKRNYWACVAVSLIAAILCGELGRGTSRVTEQFEENGSFSNGDIWGLMTIAIILIGLVIGAIAICIGIFIGNVTEVGRARYYMENREHQTKISQLFYGFRGGRFGNIVLTMFLQKLYIFLWTLLLIVPGIIKSLAYMMVPYILSENPQMDHRRALELSEQMMDGHKTEAFVLGLSFFGWLLLGSLTFGILNVFYVSPYVDATVSEFYAAVKSEAFQKGITSEFELPGHYYETF